MTSSQPHQAMHSTSPASDFGSAAGFGAVDPGAAGAAGHLTLHEFLTRLVGSAQDRAAFAQDPHGMLEQAGLGDVSPEHVVQATSLVLDYAPVDVVAEQGRLLQTSVEQFAANTPHVAVAEFGGIPNDHEESTDHRMMHSHDAKPDFSQDGDTDRHMASQHTHNEQTDIDQKDVGNGLDTHDNNVNILSGNDASDVSHDVTGVADDSVHNVTNVAGDAGSAVSGLAQTGMNNLADASQNALDHAPANPAAALPTDHLQDLAHAAPAPVADVASGDPSSALHDAASNVPGADAVSGVADDPAGALQDAAGQVPGADALSGVADQGTVGQAAHGLAADPAGAVQGIAADPASTAQHVAGGAVSDLGGADHLF